MKLNPKFSSPENAWEQYLEFSPAAKTFTQNHPEIWKSEDLLTPRGKGRWEVDWKDISAQKSLDALRVWQKKEIIRLGFLEFTTDISVQESTHALSQLADFCLQKILETTSAHMESKFKDQKNSLTILGLGKLGGDELNYSSDIDIVFIYNEEAADLHLLYNDLAKQIAQELTSSSPQLYRVDLRLRPEGGKGPLARSIEACENYYAEFGEMWERLAMLKARFCAGDQETAYEFQQMIQPFCYARSMVPDLLAEIAFLKERTEKEIVGEKNQNHHVKLGRGGIRDIEFYVQGQQLLHGARQPYLQQSNTLKTLDELLRLNLIDRDKFHLLKNAYIFWRRLEHRLQIVDHRQTHLLPKDTQALEIVAQSLDYKSGEELWNEQLELRKNVRAIYDEFYADLERKKPSQKDFELNTNCFDDSEQAKRNWENLTSGSAEFHVSRRTLESFQRLAPHLSESLNESLRPDLALVQFVSFVQVYGSRSLLYESLSSNPKALDLLIKLFDSSQYMGEIIRSSPGIFEAVARRNLNEEYSLDDYLSEIRSTLKHHSSAFPAVRLFKREQIVRIALRWLLDLSTLEILFAEMSRLADACLQIGWEVVGKPKLAVIALGKHGGRQLGFGSDLDLLFVGKDISAAQEWIRFVTEKTSDGTLFPVDIKLRPFSEGPAAYSLDEYKKYYSEDAQLWEIQALTRARFIAGDASLGEQFIQMAKNIWSRQSKQSDLKEKILDMRRKIEEGRCKSGKPDLEFKTGSGGMIDIEFALQYWQMKNNFFEPIFKTAFEKFIQENKEFQKLSDHYHFFRNIETWLRFDLNLSASHLPTDPKGLNYISRRFNFDSPEKFLQHLHQIRIETRQLFNKTLL